MTPDQFLHRCPALWHIAPAGAWDAIRETGLLSAAQLIEAAELDEDRRTELRDTPRSEAVTITVDGADVVLRDQAPLLKADLAKVLEPGLTVADWVQVLNRRVYLYADRTAMQKALEKFVAAEGDQDILIFSPRRLVEQEQHRIELSAQNTAANSRRSDPSKGRDTFVSVTRFADKKPAEVTLVGGLTDLTPIVRAERQHADGTRTPLSR